MIRRLLTAYRQAKQHDELERYMSSMRLGMTTQELDERRRRHRAGNSVIALMIFLGFAGFVFAATDPIFDTLALMLRAIG